jgi:hypothetical protein
MYPFLLTFHNIARWLVIIFALIAIIRAFSGWFGRKDWTGGDNRAGLLYTIILDIQLLVGVILYVWPGIYLSRFMTNPAAAMADHETRFYVIEHLIMMVLAVILAHVGRALSKRAPEAIRKHRRAAIWYTLSLLIILASIPWPFMASIGRPWLRVFGLEIP